MRDASPSPLLSRKEAARYLNLSPGTLAVSDCTKRHNLNPIKVGGAVECSLSFKELCSVLLKTIAHIKHRQIHGY